MLSVMGQNIAKWYTALVVFLIVLSTTVATICCFWWEDVFVLANPSLGTCESLFGSWVPWHFLKYVTSSLSGVILRDSHGVAQVRFVTGNKILRILKSKGLAPDLPEDLYHLIKKAVAVRKHLERNRKVNSWYIVKFGSFNQSKSLSESTSGLSKIL